MVFDGAGRREAAPLASRQTRRLVTGNRQVRPPAGRSACALRAASVLELLARHLASHYEQQESPGSRGALTPGPSNGAKFLCKRWYAGIICFILLKIGYFFAGGERLADAILHDISEASVVVEGNRRRKSMCRSITARNASTNPSVSSVSDVSLPSDFSLAILARWSDRRRLTSTT